VGDVLKVFLLVMGCGLVPVLCDGLRDVCSVVAC